MRVPNLGAWSHLVLAIIVARTPVQAGADARGECTALDLLLPSLLHRLVPLVIYAESFLRHNNVASEWSRLCYENSTDHGFKLQYEELARSIKVQGMAGRMPSSARKTAADMQLVAAAIAADPALPMPGWSAVRGAWTSVASKETIVELDAAAADELSAPSRWLRDAFLLRYLELKAQRAANGTLHSMVLFPNSGDAEWRWKRAHTMIHQYGLVVLGSRFMGLDLDSAATFMEHLYEGLPSMDKGKCARKASWCGFRKNAVKKVRLVFIESPTPIALDRVLEMKNRLRAEFGGTKNSVHVSDSHAEMLSPAKIVLNGNSRDLLFKHKLFKLGAREQLSYTDDDDERKVYYVHNRRYRLNLNLPPSEPSGSLTTTALGGTGAPGVEPSWFSRVITYPYGGITVEKGGTKLTYQEGGKKAVTGRKSGITVLDFDTVEGFEELSREYPWLVRQPRVKTRRGVHVYCKYNPNLNQPTPAQGFKLDILGGSGKAKAVAVPPTQYTLEDGTFFTYRWEQTGPLDDIPDGLSARLRESFISRLNPPPAPPPPPLFLHPRTASSLPLQGHLPRRALLGNSSAFPSELPPGQLTQWSRFDIYVKAAFARVLLRHNTSRRGSTLLLRCGGAPGVASAYHSSEDANRTCTLLRTTMTPHDDEAPRGNCTRGSTFGCTHEGVWVKRSCHGTFGFLGEEIPCAPSQHMHKGRTLCRMREPCTLVDPIAFHEDAYKVMQYTFGLGEPCFKDSRKFAHVNCTEKTNFKHYLSTFHQLIASIRAHGYQVSYGRIPVCKWQSWAPMLTSNAAHRVAAALALGLPTMPIHPEVPCRHDRQTSKLSDGKRVRILFRRRWDYRFFARETNVFRDGRYGTPSSAVKSRRYRRLYDKFNESRVLPFLDAAVREAIIADPNLHVLHLWPHAVSMGYAKRLRARQLAAEYCATDGGITYGKLVPASSLALQSYVRQIKRTLPAAAGSVDPPGTTSHGLAAYIMVVRSAPDVLATCQSLIRDLYNLPGQLYETSFDATMTHADAILASRLLLHEICHGCEYDYDTHGTVDGYPKRKEYGEMSPTACSKASIAPLTGSESIACDMTGASPLEAPQHRAVGRQRNAIGGELWRYM